MKLEHDKKADALYIYLTKGKIKSGGVKHTKELDDNRLIDYDVNDKPLGIELLCVSQGVDTDGLPHKDEVERLLKENGIKVLE